MILGRCSTVPIAQASNGTASPVVLSSFGMKWMCCGSHQYRIKDRIILFRFDREDGNTAEVVEVMDVGTREMGFLKTNLSKFVAYRPLEGFASENLTLNLFLELSAKGLFKTVTDFYRRERLSLERWDKFLEILKIRVQSRK